MPLPEPIVHPIQVTGPPTERLNLIVSLRLWYSDGLVNPLARGTTYGPAPLNYADYYPPGVNPCETGNQAHNRILDTYVAPVLGIPRTSQNLQTLAIFNTFTYGGIGGTQATTSGGSPQGPLISLHELGHSLGTMADEYPYSSRDVVRPCYAGGEPGSFHHTIYTSLALMIADQHKWWRWIGEESLSGGARPARGRRHVPVRPAPAERALDHALDRLRLGSGRAHGRPHHWPKECRADGVEQYARGHRAAGRRALGRNAASEIPRARHHVADRRPERYDARHRQQRQPRPRNAQPGARDRRPPGGARPCRPRRHGLGAEPLDRQQLDELGLQRAAVRPDQAVDRRRHDGGALAAGRRGHPVLVDQQPVGGDEVVFVETNHPTDRVLDVAWRLDGNPIPNPHNSRNLDLGALGLPAGTSALTATVTDPADPGGVSDTVQWTVDNVLPTAHRTLSEPLTVLDDDLEHPVYFSGWDTFLDPKDDLAGYDEERFVVGQLRLDQDGWFNYFGFPEQQDAPFQFRHIGTDIKALTYGNLGSGGLSRATFEQTLPDDHPSGGFIPGFGTHFVEHRAIDPAGNYGTAESYRATVLPGASPECTRTLAGVQRGGVVVTSGVTCLDGATVNGAVVVRPGASLVASDTVINGTLRATGANSVQVFGTRVTGETSLTGTTSDITIAGSRFNGGLTLVDNTQVSANERYSRLAGAYGPILVGSTVNDALSCTGNSAELKDFGAPNTINGPQGGDCAAL